MARNSGDGYRIGAVRQRSQSWNPTTQRWTKQGSNGRFMDQKADSKPFKGVTKND